MNLRAVTTGDDGPCPTASRCVASHRVAVLLVAVLLGGVAVVACSRREPPPSPGGGSAGADASRLPPASAPGIVFDETSFDFGTIFQKDTANHAFRFRSAGTKPVRITRVKTVCACTIPRYTKDPVAPGDTGEILVTFNAGTRFGKIDKEIRVFTDDPEHPEISLVLRGTVKREFWFTPTRIVLEDLRHGVPVEDKRFRVHWLREVDLHVTSIEATHESLQIVSREPFEDSNSRGIEVTVRIGDWEKALEESKGNAYTHFVVVRTDHPKYPQATLPVTGGRFQPIRWEPKVLMLGVIPQGKEVHKTVSIMTPRGIDLEIERLESPDFIAMELEQTPAPPGDGNGGGASPGVRLFRVGITVLASAPRGSFKEHLKIHTNLAEKPIVTVYVYGKIE